jgi:hypothetical protein
MVADGFGRMKDAASTYVLRPRLTDGMSFDWEGEGLESEDD